MDIGLFEAKNRLSELVGLAELGQEVVITRRGLPVAKLVSVGQGLDRQAEAKAAKDRIAEIRDSLGGPTVTLAEILAWKREGKK